MSEQDEWQFCDECQTFHCCLDWCFDSNEGWGNDWIEVGDNNE